MHVNFAFVYPHAVDVVSVTPNPLQGSCDRGKTRAVASFTNSLLYTPISQTVLGIVF